MQNLTPPRSASLLESKSWISNATFGLLTSIENFVVLRFVVSTCDEVASVNQAAD